MRSRAEWAALLTVALLVAGCGGSPTAPDAQQPSETEAEQDGATAAAEDPFAPVLAELDGLEGDERQARLLELAQEEGSLSLYTSNTDAADFAETFTDEFDVEVEVYRARANDVLQRLVEEDDAGFAGADMVDTNMEELIRLDDGEELLAPYDGPAEEGLPEEALYPGWTGSRFNVFVTAQNTDLLPEADRPADYEALADASYDGLMIIEPRAYEWFMTLHLHMQEQGMGEEEADDLWRSIAANAIQVEGHTNQAQFLAAGEYGLAAGTYNHLIDGAAADGAPVTWRPALTPTVVRPNGQGLLKTAQNPAAALLFFEWVLTDGQQLIADADRVPANSEYQGGILDDVETLFVDGNLLVEDGADWEARYEEILRESEVGPEGSG